MVAGIFVVNEWVYLNQDAQISDIYNLPSYNVDYQLTLNGVDLTNIFNVHFQQNAANADLFDVSNNSDSNRLAALLTSTATWSAGATNAAVAVGLTGVDSAPNRILETVALRVFGHAAARAAIVNDTQFPTSVGALASPFLSALMNHRNELFNEYVKLGRISNIDDVTQQQTMDLSNMNISFLLEVDGRILDPSNNPITTVYENGFAGYNTAAPSGSGNVYSTMNNGQYAIPVLVTFNS